MKQIGANGWVGEGALQMMNDELARHNGKVFFLVDENTHEHCLPVLLGELASLGEYEVLEVPAGEESKDIEVVANLWQALAELSADRQSLLINVGGGMVTDLGGFVAATYMRGIRFWQVPTSLLGMVDAALGGKTGIDVGDIKNLAGTFTPADKVFVYPPFLETLPERELKSGYAEVLKHAIISGKPMWQLAQKSWAEQHFTEIIREAIHVKNSIVADDPLEQGKRKLLNLGHTLGHAVESYFLKYEKPILHGEAIGAGLMMEAWISHTYMQFERARFNEIVREVRGILPDLHWSEHDDVNILYWLQFDKKNSDGEQYYTLIRKMGDCMHGMPFPIEVAAEALAWYRKTVAK